MSLIPVDNLGAIGMIVDRKPHEILPEAWSALRNVRCFNRSLFSTYGHQSIMGVPNVLPYFLIATLDNTDTPIWAYCGITDVFATDGTTHAEITRVAGDYTGSDAALWNGDNFGGITILNNGVDVPQAWIIPSLGTKLVNLANWPAGTIAKVVRRFGRFLIALDVTVAGVRKSTLVKWSDEADIGAVPVTWDPADATKKAGEWPLLETEGPCIDCLPLGDRNVIYKSDSIHTMTRIAGRYVFAFKQIFGDLGSGILAQRCAAEYSSKHVVATTEDVIIHDGFQYTSLLEGKMRNWYMGRVNQTNAFRSFIAVNSGNDEVWVCIPESGFVFPNVALIINLKDGTNTIRDLPQLAHIQSGRPPGISQVYDSFVIPFDQMVGTFGQSTTNAARKRMIAVTPVADRNILVRSDAQNNAAWVKTELTVTIDVEGTADKLIPTAVSSIHVSTQTCTKAAETVPFTLRTKAKADGYNFLVIRGDNGTDLHLARATFDLIAGTVVGSETVGAFTISSVFVGAPDGLGYRECYITLTTETSTTLRMRVGVNATAVVGPETFVGDAVKGIRVLESYMRKGLYGAYQLTTAIAANGAFFLLDSGFDFDGVPFQARAERTGLSIMGQTRTGEPKSDLSVRKFLAELWPKMEMVSGSSVDFYIGMQEVLEGPIIWSGPFVYSPGVDLTLFPNLSGRLVALAIQSINRQLWRIDGYNVDVRPIGKL